MTVIYERDNFADKLIAAVFCTSPKIIILFKFTVTTFMILITGGHNRLIFQTKNNLTITDEQLDLLVEGLLPTMQEFFDSEIGKSIYAKYLKENDNTEKQAA